MGAYSVCGVAVMSAVMPDSLAHVHGDEGGIDISPYMPRALDDVIETILAWGVYPQPRLYPYAMRHLPARRVEFDLREWCNEHIDQSEMAELYVSMITDYSNEHDSRRMKEAARVEAMLREELRDAEITRERAERLAEEAREEA